jgi:hypothetical protein
VLDADSEGEDGTPGAAGKVKTQLLRTLRAAPY